MTTQPDKHEDAHLQHEAEHVRPTSRANVMTYLVVLFGAAFLLLLLSYFMQQRNASETIDTLKASMTSLKSIEEIQAENTALQAQVEALTAQISSLQDGLDGEAEERRTLQLQLDGLKQDNDALNYLNQIRSLYNQRKSAEARTLMAEAEAALASHGGMTGILGGISTGLSEAARENYDPLAAYQTIVGWLEQK